ncbi:MULTISPECIES: STY4528 family pathogenicity island replication protein [unclassified Gilliamella]|uniref:STY4528 family pathogenicity island replication protein n=1 Tax=unclassified Gilliamella TaxID=2685620 RepID=UPI00226A14D4|nr:MULTISPECIES: STY4528 family pathogenicity island replication protein [unclassified Gilliamella]MCX8588538.1 hypothetical protein [Gilliamella sp. B3801]MCX8592976.1 hypothetical protein [Gilliamella sp. B3804]
MTYSDKHQRQDGFIYSGNRHESVPRALFFDKRLTPLERNAWQIIRLCLDSNGTTNVPTYEYLQQFLTSMPCTEKASTETVARALSILRLTRWLSVIKRRAKDGTKQSNLYVLHDSPLTPFEALSLDEDYLTLVCDSMNHASKAIQLVAAEVLDDVANDAYLSTKQLPSRLDLLLNRTIEQNDLEKLSTVHKSEGSTMDLLRNQRKQISESETGTQSLKTKDIRNPKSAISSNKNKILLPPYLPDRFYKLSTTQRTGILKVMSQLSTEVQQQVLNEWDGRCTLQKINNPAAYLFGITQKAIKGELNELRTEQKSSEQPELQIEAKDESPTSPHQDKRKIQAHIDHLKQLLVTNR